MAKNALKKVTTETPLAEITLRKYEKPDNLDSRDLMKKVCLSLGLLQPGDSRDVIVDILNAIVNSKSGLMTDEIVSKVKKSREVLGLPQVGVAHSNVIRQIRRLKEIFLIEKTANRYHVTEGESLVTIFEEKIERYYLRSITERVKEYLSKVQKK